jgi:hypothetical protein
MWMGKGPKKANAHKAVAFHHPGSPAEVEQEAASLLKALS